MKVLISLAFFWLGISFTLGTRVPGNCGNDDTLRITSLQPPGTIEDQWAVGYHGKMFHAVVRYDYVYTIKWILKYGDVKENFEFNWSGWKSGYVASPENTKNGAFHAIRPEYNSANAKAQSNITKNIGKYVDQFSLKFTTDDAEIGACSITNIVFKECQTTLPLKVDSPSTNYGSIGKFQCAKGYVWSHMHSGRSTKCMSDATWKNADVNKCLIKVCQAMAPLMVFSTTSIYLSEGQFSCPENYDLVPFNSNTNTKCLENGKWENSDDFSCYRECHTEDPLSVNSTSSKYSAKGHFNCEDGYHLFPMNQNIQTICMKDTKWKNQDKFKCYKDCRKEQPILVNSTSSTYSSEGHFYCDEGFDLFPVNRSTTTKCSENGKWENSNEFQCYSAPNDTRIVGNLMIKEHETMEIYCNFTQTNPTAYTSKFSFVNETFEKSLNKPYTRIIKSTDDGKEIWCQPISNYTESEKFAEKGKSPTRQLRVFFAPKSINHDNLTCDWTIGSENSCDFTFLSRPSAENISLLVVRNESVVGVDFKFSHSSVDLTQTITITEIENNQLSSQRFRLQIISSLFPDHLFTIPFDLNMIRNVYIAEIKPKSIKSSHITIVIGIVAGTIVIILLISLVIIIKRRQLRNNNNNNALANEVVAEDRINAIYETTDDVRGNSVTEERCNVIYSSGLVGTEGEYVREERCNIIYEGGDFGAVEKVNPIYGSVLNQFPTKKTNNKKQHQATSSSDKNDVHSLNDSDHVYASVVESRTTEKKNKTSIQNDQKLNDSEQLYAEVDVTKKKKEFKSNTSPQNHQSVNDLELYASVDISQKKKTNLNGDTTTHNHPNFDDSEQLYSSIDVSKKKANKNLPGTSTQGRESLNDSELYASVDVSKKTGNKLIGKISTDDPSQLYANVKRK